LKGKHCSEGAAVDLGKVGYRDVLGPPKATLVLLCVATNGRAHVENETTPDVSKHPVSAI
jgi:hypothetical protein